MTVDRSEWSAAIAMFREANEARKTTQETFNSALNLLVESAVGAIKHGEEVTAAPVVPAPTLAITVDEVAVAMGNLDIIREALAGSKVKHPRLWSASDVVSTLLTKLHEDLLTVEEDDDPFSGDTSEGRVKPEPTSPKANTDRVDTSLQAHEAAKEMAKEDQLPRDQKPQGPITARQALQQDADAAIARYKGQELLWITAYKNAVVSNAQRPQVPANIARQLSTTDIAALKSLIERAYGARS